MTNEEAKEALEEYVEAAQSAVREAVWALAFLVEGGEPTWDAVKSVSRGAVALEKACAPVAELEEVFEEIIP